MRFAKTQAAIAVNLLLSASFLLPRPCLSRGGW